METLIWVVILNTQIILHKLVGTDFEKCFWLFAAMISACAVIVNALTQWPFL